MRKTIALFLVFVYVISIAAPAYASGDLATDTVLTDTARVVYGLVKNPQVGMVGGDWAVFGLVRSGYTIPRAYYDNYYKNVENYVKEHKGVLDERKYTEYSRVVIALTAAGYDPRDVGGYDLTAPLGDYGKTVWQGVNGIIFALLALDSADYDIPANTNAAVVATREAYVAELIRRQLPDGGFALSAAAGESDPDITAMALQALAKYDERSDVAAAITRALGCLASMRGGYAAWGAEGSESVVQAIVALCELGLGINDARFNADGITLMDILMDYYITGKGFERQIGGGVNQMATEQALYALAAARRLEDGKTSLYDMSDTGVNKKQEAQNARGLTGKHGDVKVMPVIGEGKTFSDINAHAYKTSIEELSARGVINGKNNISFEPDSPITRAEYATIIVKGLGLKEYAADYFGDVKPGEWYYGYIGAAYKYGIVNGISPTTFNPEGNVTREEAATMTARAAKLCGFDVEPDDEATKSALAGFNDGAAISDWARKPLAFLCGEGIIPSGAAKEIKPKEAITRGEIAEMLYRMLSIAELL